MVDAGDRTLDHQPHTEYEPGQDHRVKRHAAQLEHERRGHERKWNHHQADGEAPPFEQQRAERADDEHSADQQAQGQIGRRQLDEACWTENGGIYFDAFKTRSQILQCGLHTARNVRGVGPGQLLDHQQ